MSLEQRCYNALNRLTKWRSVFAGWQLGTRTDTDPECKAVKDHREVTILLRVEVTSLAKILIDKGVMTQEDFQHEMIKEAELLSQDYERRFPGMKATDIGIRYDKRAAETMKNWKP
jgi:hypothetical protein